MIINVFLEERFEIYVNYETRRFFTRIPLIDTTNEDLGALLPPIDQVALCSRVKQYALNEKM